MFATSALNLRTFKPEVSLAFLFAAVLFCHVRNVTSLQRLCTRFHGYKKCWGAQYKTSHQFEEALTAGSCKKWEVLSLRLLSVSEESLHCTAEKEVKLVLDTLWGSHNLERRYRSALYLGGEQRY